MNIDDILATFGRDRIQALQFDGQGAVIGVTLLPMPKATAESTEKPPTQAEKPAKVRLSLSEAADKLPPLYVLGE